MEAQAEVEAEVEAEAEAEAAQQTRGGCSVSRWLSLWPRLRVSAVEKSMQRVRDTYHLVLVCASVASANWFR